MSYQAEYSGSTDEPYPCCGPRPRSPRPARSRHLGLRRVVDEPGDRQRLGLRALAGLRVPGPPAGPRRQAGHVRGPPHDFTRTGPTPGPSAWRRPRSTPTRALVRHRAGVHVLQDGRPSAGRSTATPPPGPYYCGVRRRQDARPAIVERHTRPAWTPGLGIEGTNAEVMMASGSSRSGFSASRTSATSSGGPLAALRIAEDFGSRHARAQAVV